MKVLSTKQLDETLITSYLQRGVEVTCVEMIRVSPVTIHVLLQDLATADVIAFTSSNAVKYALQDTALAALCAAKPVYALSGKTKQALQHHGIAVIATADDAESLGHLIIQNDQINSLLHLTGNLKLDTLQHTIEEADITYQSVEVYHTELLSPKVEEAYAAILFFSPSGIDSYLTHNEINTDTRCCCIGATTTDHLKSKVPDAHIITSAAPSPAAMLDSLIDYHTHDR